MPGQSPVLEKVGMVGTGSMGSGMSMLFAEYGTKVFFYDPSDDSSKSLLDGARKSGLEDMIKRTDSYRDLVRKVDQKDGSKFFVFSIPHGDIGDKVVDELSPHLARGDVILDASNEYWKNTERRQHKLEPHGIYYIGMGVSGGYQSARHGPSISPGGSKEGLAKAMPFLKQVAAKDKDGNPCTVPVGPAGSGHYVKMVHNGIEQAMLSILCEVWGIMHKGLVMEYEEIAKIFFEWNEDGQLSQNFLVAIGADICRTKNYRGEYVLATIRDKVVQDVDESEGTGVWTVAESANLHVSCPSIASGHLFRVASAYFAQRQESVKSLGAIEATNINLAASREEAIQMLKDTTYSTFLMSYIQGIHLIEAASKKYKWNIDLAAIMQLWRGGCIIQSDYIVDMLYRVLAKGESRDNLLADPEVAKELKKTTPNLRQVVIRAMESDQVIPTVSQTWEWYKYHCSVKLPTSFHEAQLDYFGWHMYDTVNDPPGAPVTGKHHYEWRPAKGIREKADPLPYRK